MHFDKYTHLGNHQPISFPSSQKVPSYPSQPTPTCPPMAPPMADPEQSLI